MPEPISEATSLRPGATGAPPAPVPPTRPQREEILRQVRQYVAATRPVPPFSVDQLTLHSGRVLEIAGLDEPYRKFVAVLISNEAWRDTLAAVPFNHRLFLMPKCLRSEEHCAGAIDELGLTCADCGRCPIHDLKDEAQRLGYVVLVAEGVPVVVTLIQQHQIEAVVGVSCLSALEDIYPLMEAAAIPGIAIPLLYEGCINTAVDLDWVWDAMHLSATEGARRLDLEALRHEVESWFAEDALDATLGPSSGDTERIARTWLAKSGKRWRPFLAACAFQAFRNDPDGPLPEGLRKLALSVECFHKASLVHDDIEDGDALRYGEKTLHERYGVPIALNVGDFLIGEGYRLIAESGMPPAYQAEMLRVAACGHRDLAIGQGSELCWARSPRPLGPAEVLEIFRRKTAPAFAVALHFGAIAAGAPPEVRNVLHRYSEALGIAYQIRDDLKDWRGDDGPDDILAMRPSILLALAYPRATGDAKRLLESLWRRAAKSRAAPGEIRRILDELQVEEETRRLLETQKDEAMRALEPLLSTALKGLLRRVIFRIFHDIEPRGSLGESEARNAPGRAPGSEFAA